MVSAITAFPLQATGRRHIKLRSGSSAIFRAASSVANGRDGVIIPTLSEDRTDEKHVTFSKSGLKRLKAGLDRAGLDAGFFAGRHSQWRAFRRRPGKVFCRETPHVYRPSAANEAVSQHRIEWHPGRKHTFYNTKYSSIILRLMTTTPCIERTSSAIICIALAAARRQRPPDQSSHADSRRWLFGILSRQRKP